MTFHDKNGKIGTSSRPKTGMICHTDALRSCATPSSSSSAGERRGTFAGTLGRTSTCEWFLAWRAHQSADPRGRYCDYTTSSSERSPKAEQRGARSKKERVVWKYNRNWEHSAKYRRMRGIRENMTLQWRQLERWKPGAGRSCP